MPIDNRPIITRFCVDDCYPLIPATAYEKNIKIGTPVELLMVEANFEIQTQLLDIFNHNCWGNSSPVQMCKLVLQDVLFFQ